MNRAEAYRTILRAHLEEKRAIARIVRARVQRRLAAVRLRHRRAPSLVHGLLAEIRCRLEQLARRVTRGPGSRR